MAKEKEMKFATQEQVIRGGYFTYNTVLDSIVQEVQKKYKYGSDIAKSLRDGKLFDLSSIMPVRRVSEETNETTRMIEQDGFNIQFQEEFRVYLDRKSILEDNLHKTYSAIYSTYCTKQMQDRIEQHPDFEKFRDDPLKLLKTIKTLTHNTVRAQYPIASIVESLARWIVSRQGEDEPLMEYVKRSKQNRDIVKSQIGTKLIHEYIKTTSEYVNETDVDKQAAMINKSFEQVSAYIMLRGADQSKYGTLMKGFTQQYSLKNDQYPRTINDATDALGKHLFDPAYYEKKKRRGNNKKTDDEDEEKAGEKRGEKTFNQIGKKSIAAVPRTTLCRNARTRANRSRSG
jgi:hypothetical protein